MDGDVRVTTMIVGLLIALCAVLLAKWLALVALAALVLLALMRFAWRRGARAIRARRAPTAPEDPAPTSLTDRRGAPDCSWCGLVGGHRDLRGRPVRPRHAHVLPAPARHAS